VDIRRVGDQWHVFAKGGREDTGLTLTLSAPQFKTRSKSDTSLIPPPTVRGIKTSEATPFKISVNKTLARFYNEQGADELVFYDITASAEERGLFTDILKGSCKPAKFTPLTTRPSRTSKHGTILFAIIGHPPHRLLKHPLAFNGSLKLEDVLAVGEEDDQ
jgi:hypothetical protein